MPPYFRSGRVAIPMSRRSFAEGTRPQTSGSFAATLKQPIAAERPSRRARLKRLITENAPVRTTLASIRRVDDKEQSDQNETASEQSGGREFFAQKGECIYIYIYKV